MNWEEMSHRGAGVVMIGALLAACGLDTRDVDVVGGAPGVNGPSTSAAGPEGSAGVGGPGASSTGVTPGGVPAAAGGAGASGVGAGGAPGALGGDGGTFGTGASTPPPPPPPFGFDLAAVLDPETTGLFLEPSVDTFRSTGISVAGGDDVNGDGVADYVVGVDKYGRVGDFVFGTGAAFVVFGGARRENLQLADVGGAVPGLRIEGQGIYGSIGRFVAMLGDVNGDGLGDLMSSTALDTTNDGYEATGAYLVIFGRAASGSVDIGPIVRGEGGGFLIDGRLLHVGLGGLQQGQAPFGPAGDVNGDGLADILVAPEVGPRHVVLGKASASPVTLSDDGASVAGVVTIDLTFGGLRRPFARVGDVNGDGVDDFAGRYSRRDGVVSARTRVRVLFGQTGLTGPLLADESSGFDVVANAPIGEALAAAGDVNGDGYGDVLIGAPSTGTNQAVLAPSAYVVFGKPDTAEVDIDLAGGFAIRAIATVGLREALGASLASAGDVNGDGLDDVLIADPLNDNLYLVYGKTDTDLLGAEFLETNARGRRVMRLLQGDLQAGLGASLSPAGDLDADGRMDFVIGAPLARFGYADAIGPGAAWILYGAALLGTSGP